MAEEKASPKFKWVRRKKEIPEIYGNFSHVNWTLFDVTIRIGQLVPADESEPGAPGFVVDEQAAVTFSWDQAKILRDLLAKLVASYEKENGEMKPRKLAQDPTRSDAQEATE